MDEHQQRERKPDLPVTGEVGGEGGSFADPTYQKTAREEDPGRDGLARADESREPDEAAEVAQNALHREEITNGGVGTSPGPGTGIKRYPTE